MGKHLVIYPTGMVEVTGPATFRLIAVRGQRVEIEVEAEPEVVFRFKRRAESQERRTEGLTPSPPRV